MAYILVIIVGIGGTGRSATAKTMFAALVFRRGGHAKNQARFCVV